jgi:hypothetical protein
MRGSSGLPFVRVGRTDGELQYRVGASAGLYRLDLARSASYIQRRQPAGNSPVFPNKPANIPNRKAVPKTKTTRHPIQSAVNIRTSGLEYFCHPIPART